MLKNIFIVLLLTAGIFLPVKKEAEAALHPVTSPKGEEAVYDDVSDLLWMRDLSTFTNLTYDGLISHIDGLVASQYMGLENWHLASRTEAETLEQYSFQDTTIFYPSLTFFYNNGIHYYTDYRHGRIEQVSPTSITARVVAGTGYTSLLDSSNFTSPWQFFESFWPEGENDSASDRAGAWVASNTQLPLDGVLIETSPLSHSFGPVLASQDRKVVTIRVANGGLENLRPSPPSITGTDAGDFLIHDDNCSGAVFPVKHNCVIEVAFTPQSRGFKNATLNVPSNDQDDIFFEKSCC